MYDQGKVTDIPQCQEHVYDGSRSDMFGHQCTHKGVVERNGAWWCKMHDPDRQAAKRNNWTIAYELGDVATSLKYAIASKAHAIVQYVETSELLDVVVLSQLGKEIKELRRQQTEAIAAHEAFKKQHKIR